MWYYDMFLSFSGHSGSYEAAKTKISLFGSAMCVFFFGGGGLGGSFDSVVYIFVD